MIRKLITGHRSNFFQNNWGSSIIFGDQCGLSGGWLSVEGVGFYWDLGNANTRSWNSISFI